MGTISREIRSLITPEGELRLTLEDVPVPVPEADEVVVRVEAAPINPSDVGDMLGPADLTTLSTARPEGRPVTTAKIPPQFASRAAPRTGKSMSMGNEGAGVVVDAGKDAEHLIGKVVGAMAGRMFTSHRTLNMKDILVFPDGVSPKQSAAAFVNPLTALGMVSTMRSEGHSALVHTAAASNLGQMLNKLCLASNS
jgi:NADPH:quinone reductase